jgi:hypothetical protein
MLLSVASTLQRERVTYVGIMATDILDAVFLTRFLRKTTPDSRVFLLDSDLLFARAELNVPMEGILDVTTYPLFGRNQHGTETELKGKLSRRTAFPNRYSEAEYNAARRQLYQMNAIDKARSTDELLLDYRTPVVRPCSANRPPLWLTVLGRDGFWPVALLDQAFEKGETPASSLLPGPPVAPLTEELHPDSPSHLWLFILGSLAILGSLHASFVSFVYLSPEPPAKILPEVRSIWRAISRGSRYASPGPKIPSPVRGRAGVAAVLRSTVASANRKPEFPSIPAKPDRERRRFGESHCPTPAAPASSTANRARHTQSANVVERCAGSRSSSDRHQTIGGAADARDRRAIGLGRQPLGSTQFDPEERDEVIQSTCRP